MIFTGSQTAETNIERNARAAKTSPQEHSTAIAHLRALVETLLARGAAVAVLGLSHSSKSSQVCFQIACQVAQLDKRVLLIDASQLLELSSSQSVEYAGSKHKNIYMWPSPELPRKEPVIGPLPRLGTHEWYDSLRRQYDFILVDCSKMEDLGVDIAALVDNAIIVVEAGQTTKEEVRRACGYLRIRGLDLVGSVLIAGEQR